MNFIDKEKLVKYLYDEGYLKEPYGLVKIDKVKLKEFTITQENIK
jgi:hypothetical protein